MALRLFAAFLLFGLVAVAQNPDPKLVGKWTADLGGVQMSWTFKADGTGDLMGDAFRWETPGPGVLVIMDDSGTTEYKMQLQGAQLTLSGGDLKSPVTFKKSGGASAATTGPMARAQQRAQQQQTPAAAPARPAPRQQPAAQPDEGGDVGATGMHGNRFSKQDWGVSFAVPQGWQAFDKQVAVILKSETEPGIVFVRFQYKASMQQLQQGYQEGLHEEGLNLMPISQIESVQAGRHQAVAGVLGGMSTDGIDLRVRGYGILSPFGSAAVIFGLTASKDYDAMKRLVDSLAQSFNFVKPKDSGIRQLIAGNYWYYSSSSSSYSSSSSSERKIDLCMDGSFRRGGESYTSVQSGSVAGQSSSAGTWTAQGNEMQGVIILSYSNGQQEELQYEVSQNPKDRSGYGPALKIGGTLYQKTGSGQCQ